MTPKPSTLLYLPISMSSLTGEESGIRFRNNRGDGGGRALITDPNFKIKH